MEFLETQRTRFPDLEGLYVNLLVQHQSRLWHQLTETLLTLLSTPGASRGDNFVQLYQHFISQFEGRLNQLKFVQMLSYIAAQFCGSRPYVAAEVDQAVAFLGTFVDKRKRLGEDAFSVLVALQAEFLLKRAAARTELESRNADLDAAKAALDASKQVIDVLVETDSVVHAAYFHAASEYYKIRGPASLYYANALQYIAHMSVDGVPLEDRRVLAVDIALAALVGEGVFNFGEIIEAPILSSLEGTPDAWLADLLKVFHTGNVDAFNMVVSANLTAYQAQSALVAFDAAIKEKVALVCMMELASQRPAGERSLSFVDIATATRLPVEQVEWLLMRAMSVGLIRGSIDEVDQVVHVSYIKPRVLSMAQVGGLKATVAGWSEKVKTSLFFVEDKTRELFA